MMRLNMPTASKPSLDRKKLLRTSSALLLGPLVLIGCDSGGGGGAPATDLNKGQFVDSPVSGLHYKTETQSGLTDEDGSFYYKDGETVVFSLGKTELGRTSGQEVVTPFDITGHRALETEVEILSALNENRPANSYERSLNIANLLQSLDNDGNPENGIDLGDAHTDLSELDIPIHVKALTFNQSEAFQAAKKLTGRTSERNFSAVMNHLYTQLNITIASSKTAKQSNIFGANSTQSLSFNYDTDGNLSSIDIDVDSDGNIDGRKSFAYDSQGNITNIDDTLNNISESLSYNEANQITQRVTNKDKGTNTEETFAYDDNGQLTQFAFDEDADGNNDVSTSYSYDNSGRLNQITIDKNGDNHADSTTEYRFSNQQLKEYIEDSDGNGETDLSISYRYDSKGNRVTQNTRKASNSLSYSTSSFEYDANNNPIRYERDDNQDGIPEYIEAYKYNSASQRIQYLKDHDADGKWDFVAQYTYDINGNRIEMIEDSDGNGIVDKVWASNHEAAILDDSWDRIIELL